MDIIFDSNIFRSDITLRSKNFEIVLDYLKKTNSNILLPQIILDEISGLYRKTLTDRLHEYSSATDNLNLTLTDAKKHVKGIDIDVKTELDLYIDFVKKRLSIKERDIIPYKNELLPEITQRLINRVKPGGEDGQGFRDTLIWLTMKSYCIEQREKQLIFISNNPADFSNKEKTDLHPSLIEECRSSNINIRYYKTIKDFIEKHSININFITRDWLGDNIDESTAEELMSDEIRRHDYSYIDSCIKRKTNLDFAGHYEITSAQLIELNDFFVYEKTDKQLIVNLDVVFYIGIEFEFYNGPYLVQVDWDRYEPDYSISSHHHYFNAPACLTLTIEDRKIIDYDISDVTLE